MSQSLDTHRFALTVDEETGMIANDTTHRASDSRETFTTMSTTPTATAPRVDRDTEATRAYLERIAAEVQARTERTAPRTAGNSGNGAHLARLVPGNNSDALARALRRVEEDPEGADAMLEAIDAAEQARQADVRRAKLWEAYDKHRPVIYASRDYNALLEQMNPKNRVKSWWRNGALNLVLAGHAGHGKTTAAYAVCNEVAGDSRTGATTKPVHVVTWMAGDLMKELRPLSGAGARDEVRVARQRRIEHEVRVCDLLLLDDITREAGGEGWTIEEWRQTLHSILDERVTNQRRTVFTVNAKTGPELPVVLVEKYGEPIYSRIKGNATAAWIQGEELREWRPAGDEGFDFGD